MAGGRLKCFVAMALDRPDTDDFYRKLVQPTLRECGIQGERVIDINHNDDIDDRIIAMLDAADFVIADLTYARPSVYYEAGYAARRVQVIYTCRRDHFKPLENDPFGNFRVHFDVQMKNIIPWGSPADSVCARKLAARVRKIVAPLIRTRQRQAHDRKAAEYFRALSRNDQAAQIASVATSRLRSYNGDRLWDLSAYRKLQEGPWRRDSERERFFTRSLSTIFSEGMLVTTRKEGVTAWDAWVIYVGIGTGARQVKAAKEVLFPAPFYPLNNISSNQTIREHIVLCSTQSISRRALATALPDASSLDGGSVLHWKTTVMSTSEVIPVGATLFSVPWGRTSREQWPFLVNKETGKSGSVTSSKPVRELARIGGMVVQVTAVSPRSPLVLRRHIWVHVIDQIRSVSDAKQRLMSVMATEW